MTYLQDDLHLALEPNAPLAGVHRDVATYLLADVVERRNETVVDAGAVDVEDTVLRGVRAIEQTHPLRPLPQLVQLLLQNNKQSSGRVFESHWRRLETLAFSFSQLCQCLSEERLKAVGPFSLVSMPGEVKYIVFWEVSNVRELSVLMCV